MPAVAFQPTKDGHQCESRVVCRSAECRCLLAVRV
jgi:hypothetical protein